MERAPEYFTLHSYISKEWPPQWAWPDRFEAASQLEDYLVRVAGYFGARQTALLAARSGFAPRSCTRLRGKLPVPLYEAGEILTLPTIGVAPVISGRDAIAAAPDTRIRVPIGDYGEGLARDILCTTAELLEDWNRISVEMAARPEFRIHSGTPLHYAAIAGMYQYRVGDSQREGLQTVGAALAQLSSYRVPGFEDDPWGLMRAALKAGIVDELAMLLPFNSLAPGSNNCGRFSMPPLLPDSESGLRLNPDLRRAILERKRLAVAENAGRSRDSMVFNRTAFRNIGCVAARSRAGRSSAVTLAAERFIATGMAVARSLERRPQAAPRPPAPLWRNL